MFLRGHVVAVAVALGACDAGLVTDGVGGSADAGALVDPIDGGAVPVADGGDPSDAATSSPDAAVPDAGDGSETLARVDGCFFSVAGVGDLYEVDVGVAGTRYRWLRFDYTVEAGPWREDLYDRPALNHGLFGIERNVSAFEGRYILGNAAQIKPDVASLDRKSVFYGRNDLEKKPPGLGYTGYTSWRAGMPWVPGQRYRVSILLDAVGGEQWLEIRRAGEVVSSSFGDIPYFEPSLTEATFTATFGGIESEEREVKPLGWTFCDFVVRAEPM